MAVDYQGYARYMGARNPVADSLNQIGATIDQGQEMELRRNDATRRNTLADLQIEQGQMQMQSLKDEAAYKQGLQDAIANPQSATSVAPPTKSGSLADLMPVNSALQPQGEFELPQNPASPTVQAYNEGRVSTKTDSGAMAGAKYAASKGRFDDVKKLMDVDDMMNQYAATVLESGGDPAAYKAAKMKLASAKEFAGVVKDFAKNPELLKQMWPIIAKAYPDAAAIGPELVTATKDGVVIPLTVDGKVIENRYVMYDENGKGQIIDATPKPDQEALLDKRLAFQSAETNKQIAAADRRALNANRGGSGGGKPPVGYRQTADGNLEAIPGGPADVKAETKRQSVENGKAAIDASVETIDKLLNHPGRVAATGFSSLNPINKIPGTNASDFNKELESFDSKLFLSNIQAMKGMGALSNAEGAKVSAAAGAIKAGMSEKAFVANMNTIKKALADAKSRMDSGNLIQKSSAAPKQSGRFTIEEVK